MGSYEVFIVPAIILGGALLAGLIFEIIVLLRLRRAAEKKGRGLLGVIASSLRGMILLGLLLAGASAAVRYVPLEEKTARLIGRVIVVLAIIAATIVTERLAVGLLGLRTRKKDGALPISLIATVVKLVVMMLGVLVIFQTLGISITPMLTALGIGGLAVALALKDTLSNLFAGFHILASRLVRVGDYVQLSSGQEGYVEDISWRNTNIRAILQYMIVVPNETLASATMVNYHEPQKPTLILMPVGVHYDSDLEHVERVTKEIAREAMREVPGGDETYEPLIRFHTFNDFSIDFNVVMRVTEITAQYSLKHEFAKRLHRRYGEEGIVIPFPIRTVEFAGPVPDKAGVQ